VAKVCLFVCLLVCFFLWFCFVLSFNQAANYLSFQIYFDDMDIFKNYCVVYERHRTVPQIRVVPMDTAQDQYVVQVRLRTSTWARLPAAVREMSPRPSPEQTAGRTSLLLSITTNQIVTCSNRADSFIFLEQISNGGCKGVV